MLKSICDIIEQHLSADLTDIQFTKNILETTHFLSEARIHIKIIIQYPPGFKITVALVSAKPLIAIMLRPYFLKNIPSIDCINGLGVANRFHYPLYSTISNTISVF